jgi:hypothetical protein
MPGNQFSRGSSRLSFSFFLIKKKQKIKNKRSLPAGNTASRLFILTRRFEIIIQDNLLIRGNTQNLHLVLSAHCKKNPG